MSSDNIQRQMEFILEHQAKFSADIDRLTEAITRMAAEREADRRETRDALNEMREGLNETREGLDDTREILNSVISEMREGFNNLIVANEATRDLASKVASLVIQTSQRVTGLEQRFTDIESK